MKIRLLYLFISLAVLCGTPLSASARTAVPGTESPDIILTSDLRKRCTDPAQALREEIRENAGMAPYCYQNGGNWTWFGDRMIQALIANGYARGKVCDRHSRSSIVWSEDRTHIESYDGILFRSDTLEGPSFEGVVMRPGEKQGTLEGQKDGLSYTIRCSDDKGHLVIRAGIRNTTSSEVITNLRERLILGVNTEMLSYPQWDTVMFPTLVRCEKDFAWGYFSSTGGRILAFATEEPVASYSLNYRYEGIKKWKWGHTIYTASLDLLHCGPLPERHPQGLDRIGAGESLEWTVHLGCVDSLENVKKSLSCWAGVPMIELSSYTVPADSEVRIQCCAPGKVEASITSPSGETTLIPGDIIRNLSQTGLYRIHATCGGKTAEASLFVRPKWEWYADAVRRFIAKYPPRLGDGCEKYYGYLPAFLAAKRSPAPEYDTVIANHLERSLPALIDTATGIPDEKAQPDRIQNYSTLAVILARFYESGGDFKYLRIASRVGDYVLSCQTPDGVYRRNGTHYTAVIYPAKSMFELSDLEQAAGLKDEAARHRESAMKACIDLAARLDNIETEGDMTFEDGMISCSALQMAYAALRTDDKELRAKLTSAAEYMMDKHRCLEQRLIPDCRMRGATLRWWEALDVYFSPNQVMNSPHGWSAWTAYALAYLHKLTGREKYLRDLDELLGSCAQVMDLDGHLRWGFIPDPYVDGCVCIPGKEPYTWTVEDRIVGEQYLELIHTWCRAENEYQLSNFGQTGGSGDGTVYEIFNAIEELKLSDQRSITR